jgi:ribosomal protein S12 methylthiotransferase
MISLGCPKNLVDGEVMLGDLNRGGFDIIENHEEADAIVVNTCAFVEEAKTESINAILEAAQLKELGDKKLIITGCLAQVSKKESKRERSLYRTYRDLS